ncbi:MAG: sulfatase-like hydrolase/transferase [Planctomycetia bacterium]|nr:sulfatase-like hydrolase/transferase [Planctomycetia bacterium]
MFWFAEWDRSKGNTSQPEISVSFKPVFVVVILLLSVCTQVEAEAPIPNVVVFLVDDMGWQETSVPFHTEVTELNKRYRTPNMERLAADGMRFTQAYASAVCSPSRVSILSGMNVARHRVTNWTLRKDRSPDQPSKFVEPPQWHLNGVATKANLERTTRITPLPALLNAAGYRTIHAGKAHFGAKGTPGEDPMHFGFDVNIAGHAAGGPGSYWGEKNFSAAWRKEDRIWDVPGLEAYHGKEVYLTEAITLEAIKAVEKAVMEKKPFYLYLSHYAVHAPWEKDARFYQKYIDAGLKPFEATLASMVEGMDKSLGDVMEAVKRLHVDQNTVILFLSDNGSPSQCPHNLPLRGHKITPFEGGIRVPLIAKWPRVTEANSVNTNPVVVEDFFPTILEMAGVTKLETVQQVDGKSFVPLLKGNGNTPPDRAFVWHYPHQYGCTPFSAVRQGPWKLIYHHITRKQELFNLNDDIGETTDLAASKPDKVVELAKVLGERLRVMDAQMPTDKETRQPIEWPDRVTRKAKVAKPAEVYLLAGQSNMQGIGRIADHPADVPKTIPHTFFWTGQNFEPLVLGTTKISTRITDFGPEVGFALGTAK